MACKKDMSVSECKDSLPDNDAATKDDTSTDKNAAIYEEIRRVADFLSPISKQKIDAVLTEIEQYEAMQYEAMQYEAIRKAAAFLSPKSKRKLDAVLTEIQSTTPAKSISILLTGKTGSGKST